MVSKMFEDFTERLHDVVGTVTSASIALLRLVFLTITVVFSGVHLILFTRTEICNIEIRGNAFRCDREKNLANLAFVDKLCVENPDLMETIDEMQQADSDEDDSNGEEL